MQVSKARIVLLLRQQGQHARADQADQQLPDPIDTHEHGDLLNELGVDPKQLLSKLLGFGTPALTALRHQTASLSIVNQEQFIETVRKEEIELQGTAQADNSLPSESLGASPRNESPLPRISGSRAFRLL